MVMLQPWQEKHLLKYLGKESGDYITDEDMANIINDFFFYTYTIHKSIVEMRDKETKTEEVMDPVYVLV